MFSRKERGVDLGGEKAVGLAIVMGKKKDNPRINKQGKPSFFSDSIDISTQDRSKNLVAGDR